MTQHIPNRGEHLIRKYGFYSNKQRGVRNKKAEKGELPKDQKMKKKCSLTWAILIKLVYKDPLICPVCQCEMKIIALIDGRKQPTVVKNILKHCELWKDNTRRPPPQKEKLHIIEPDESPYDYTFFENVCA